jgi:tetratricopeptide (TPR) repeat protein
MEDSLVDRSRKAIAAEESPRSWRPSGAKGRDCAGGAALLLLALLGAARPVSAQSMADAYQRTVLSIQRQIEASNFDDARKMIEEAQKKYPANGGLENLLGVIEIQQGHADLARQDFSAAIRHDPHLAGACLNLSRIDMQSAAIDAAARAEARRLSERVLQMEPANDEANYQLATILGWEKSNQRSLDHLAKLSAHAQGEIGAEALRCSDEAALGHRDETTEAANSLAANPDLTEQDADSCLPQLRAARRADLIETIFAATANRQPLSAAGLRILGLAQEAEGKLKEARATLENAFAADSNSVVVLEDLTRVAEKLNDHKGALGYLAHARDLEPTDASLPYEFGLICLRMDLYGESRKALEEAVKLAPDNPRYNYELGIVASFGNDPAEALPYLDKYHSLKPRDAEGILALGATYFRAKDFDNALKWLKQAVASPATAPDAQFYLGRIARQEGRLDEAIGDLNRSLALRADQADVLAELGQIYVGKGDYARAATTLEYAIQLDPDNYAANFGLLQMYARSGDGRQEAQSKRFDEIKDKREEHDREMMRVIEFRPDGESENLKKPTE